MDKLENEINDILIGAEYYEMYVADVLSNIIGKKIKCYDTFIYNGMDCGIDNYLMCSCFSYDESDMMIKVYYGDNTQEINNILIYN